MSIPPLTATVPAPVPPPPEAASPPPPTPPRDTPGGGTGDAPPRDTATGRTRRSPRSDGPSPFPSLEEAVTRAVEQATAQRRRLARELRDLPPPLDTRLALLASVAEIRTAIVPPSLTTLDRRR